MGGELEELDKLKELDEWATHPTDSLKGGPLRKAAQPTNFRRGRTATQGYASLRVQPGGGNHLRKSKAPSTTLRKARATHILLFLVLLGDAKWLGKGGQFIF